MTKIITRCARETIEFAKEFALTLGDGETVLLSGDLGAGKTQFAKGMAAALGIDEEITSPTFAIHNIYHGRLTLNHFDFYRINGAEAEVLGLDEFFGQANSICLIEWWTNVKEILPRNCITVVLRVIDENTREIEIKR